jgi:hypothetical protein
MRGFFFQPEGLPLFLAVKVWPCSAPGITMEIDSDNDTQHVCFIATGYWGYRVNNVIQVLDPSCAETGAGVNSWFFWYYSGYTTGYHCNMNDNNDYGTSFTGRSLTVDITQIDPGAQYSGSVSC